MWNSLFIKLKVLLSLIFSFPYGLIIFDHVHLVRATRFHPTSYRKNKCIVFAHGSESFSAMSTLDKHLYNTCRVVICNSSLTQQRHIASGGSTTSVVCPLAATPTKVPKKIPETKKPSETITLLIVSRIDERENRKGHFELINAISKLDSKYQLRIVGDGTGVPKLKTLVVNLNLNDRVHLLGRLDESRLREEYRNASMYVMPSRQEGFGLVFVEAMAWGLPLLGCFDDAAQEIIQDRKNGRLIKNEVNEQELLEAIQDIAKNQNKYSQFAIETFYKDYSYSAFKRRLSTILTDLEI